MGLSVVVLLGAAPAAPSYQGVERVISEVRADWDDPEAPPQPNAPGWYTLFDRVTEELANYAAAPNENERLRALGRLYRISVALQGVPWHRAVELREELRAWLRPRVALAWAQRRLVEAVRGLPTTADEQVQANRQQWIDFVRDDLGSALRAYEGANTVAERIQALRRVHRAVVAVRAGNQTSPWGPSQSLESALNDLFNRRNLTVLVSPSTLAPYVMGRPLVQHEVIFFKGQTSLVTPGPRTGFALLHSDDGIALSMGQYLTSVTPTVQGFQQQVRQQGGFQGRMVTNMYHLGASIHNNGHLTMMVVIRPSGVQLIPMNANNVGAVIHSAPAPGGGLGRTLASLIGFNQRRITREVWEQSLPNIQQETAQGAAELAWIRSSQEAAQINAQIAPYILGPATIGIDQFLVTALDLRSRPHYAMINGLVQLRDALDLGADTPPPPRLTALPPNGSLAVVHAGSLLTNLAQAAFRAPEVQAVQNLMIESRPVPEDAAPADAVQMSQNVDYETFLQAVQEARAEDHPQAQAIRVFRPGQPPKFAIDARGNLVILVSDFALEVPAPSQAQRGGGLTGPPAQVYRITSPQAEIALEIEVETDEAGRPTRLSGQITAFDPGPEVQVLAINEDEDQATPLTAFTARIVANIVGARMRGQPIDVPLEAVNVAGFTLGEVTIDPSGWLRVVVVPAS